MLQEHDIFGERFRILRTLGSGGYGTVYLAEELDAGDSLLGLGAGPDGPADPVALRHVALKVLGGHVAERRFRTELQALCRLNHPNVVTVYRHGRRPQPWLAMEYVEGRPLHQLVGAEAAAEPARIIRYLIGVAEGLAHAHARGVVHRDLKPHNILVDERGTARVVDFGLSWLLQEADASQRVGTPGYLAPELLDGGETRADHRADIYSFGATLFALFAGHSPFSEPGIYATIRRQLEGRVEFPAAFPEALRGLTERCLARDPFDRPRAAEEVAEELRRLKWKASSGELTLRTPEDEPRQDLRDLLVHQVERFEHPTRGAGVRLHATVSGDPEAPPVGVFAYAGPTGAERRVHAHLASLWEGAELSLYGARPLRMADGRIVLNADGGCVPVLEPYLPVSVTEVARADGVRAEACATRNLVDLRWTRASSEALVVGNLAHAILEALVGQGESAAFGPLFHRCLAPLRLDMLAAGVDDARLPAIEQTLTEHFDYLLKWVREEMPEGMQAAEARRYSSRYGLEGRIDLALADAECFRIVELKTGRFENPEHERQVRNYALMWDHVAEADGRRVEGTLIYSRKAKQKALHRRSHAQEREVVLPRNDIIALHRFFSDGDTSFRPPSFGEHPDRCADNACRFRREQCALQTGLLGSQCGTRDAGQSLPAAFADMEPRLLERARAWYFHFTRLVEREYRIASRNMGATFRNASLDERTRQLSALAGGVRESIDAARGRIRFVIHNPGILHEGDRVVAHRGALDDEPTLHGVVCQADDRRVELRSESAGFAAWLPADGWFLEREPMRIGFRDMHRALFGLLVSNRRRRLEEIVMPEVAWERGQRSLDGVAPERPDAAALLPPVSTPATEGLNARQQEAVSSALESEGGFLLQGPPGTGKTTVIAALTASLVARGQRVLLAAHTNTAVDTMLARVVRSGFTEVLRVGYASRAGSELVEALCAAGRPPEAHFSEDLARQTERLADLTHRIRSTPVVAATTHACVSSAFFEALARTLGHDPEADPHVPLFDVVIVDEASQLTEPMALAALARAERFVLVGDDCQLPPVVAAPDALSTAVAHEVPECLRAAGVAGLDRSLFERLKPFVPGLMLVDQYRMNDVVQAFPSACFYGGRLQAAAGIAARRLPVPASFVAGLPDPALRRRIDPDQPVVWVDPGGEAVANANLAEARAVAQTAALLLEARHAADAPPPAREWIGIVAPYRAQCHAIRRLLVETLGSDEAATIEVDTVERFQGREKEVILVSLVQREWSDFVFDPRRLNVTLTRARSKVLIFGAQSLARRMQEMFWPDGVEDDPLATDAPTEETSTEGLPASEEPAIDSSPDTPPSDGVCQDAGEAAGESTHGSVGKGAPPREEAPGGPATANVAPEEGAAGPILAQAQLPMPGFD